MPKCIVCDCDLMLNSEIIRGYCHTCCQTHVQTVLDKDSFALEQYKKSKNSGRAEGSSLESGKLKKDTQQDQRTRSR